MSEEDTNWNPVAGADPIRGRIPPDGWEQFHGRLEASQRALERRLAPNLDQKRAILRARATLLAREDGNEKTSFQSLEIVEFLLARERYGIESRYVCEVQPLRDLTALPSAPPFLLGLVNVRGQILPVIDVKKFYGLPVKGLTDLNRVVIVRTDQMELGILADAITGIRSIAIDDLQSSLPTLTGIRADYLRGVTKDSLVVLDVERISSDRRMILDES